MWEPDTLEVRLLDRYHSEHPGELFLELEVGGADPTHGPRRIDGLLIPGEESVVHRQNTYAPEEAEEAIHGRRAHLLEAKRTLNRNVIGQVVAGRELVQSELQPSQIVSVAVYADRNLDLEQVCQTLGIELAHFDIETRPGGAGGIRVSDGRLDIRNPPDSARRRAFLTGWADAVEGRLYGTVRSKKTHQNMGNLFGWIYGAQPDEFRLETWERYVSTLGDEKTGP